MRQIANYIIDDEPIARGGMGRIFRARDTKGNIVAIKEILPEFATDWSIIDRIEKEVKFLVRIDHPSIVKLYSAFRDEHTQCYYIVMELVEGLNIEQYVTRHGPIPEQQAVEMMMKILDALQCVHDSHIVHRDIKPENILLSPSGHIVLCDFGICYDRQQAQPYPHQTSPAVSDDADICDNTVCGTFYYLAPEVLCSSVPFGRAVDWWSGGCLLYEMTSGNPPFMAKEKTKLLDMIMKGKLKLPPFLSSDLHSLLRGLLERNVMKRLGAEPSTFTQVGGVAKLKKHPFFKVSGGE